ncbi:hypothetical protein JOC55_002464 [Paenibacillus sacheonensis]|nr:hypothetical protein [Paenibacillus sacheonensis]
MEVNVIAAYRIKKRMSSIHTHIIPPSEGET